MNFLTTFAGVELRASESPIFFDYAKILGYIETGFPDWRERLNRNLSRRSTGKWEPLTYDKPFFAPSETIYGVTNGGRTVCYGHPVTIARMRQMIDSITIDSLREQMESFPVTARGNGESVLDALSKLAEGFTTSPDKASRVDSFRQIYNPGVIQFAPWHSAINHIIVD
jgi:hypothetical protein